MKIADLFVGLGVQGDGSAKKALKGVEGGLSDVKSMSLEAKAAILAAIYSLERMMSSATKSGTNLYQFGLQTGYSTKALQQWQYAAQQVGVSAEDTQATINSMQKTFTDAATGHGAPSGLGVVQKTLQILGESGADLDKASKTTEGMQDMLFKLQKVAQALPANIGFQALSSMGISQGVFAAMKAGAFSQDVFNKAPTISDNQQKSLTKVGAGIENIYGKIKKSMASLTAEHGGQLVTDMTIIVDKTLELVGALDQLATKLKVFEVMGGVISVLAKFMELTSGLVKDTAGDSSGLKKMVGKDSLVSDFLKWRDSVDKKTGDALIKNVVTPTVKGVQGAIKEIHHHVPQTIHFNHDGKDHHKTTDSVKKAIKTSYWQNPAITQVT